MTTWLLALSAAAILAAPAAAASRAGHAFDVPAPAGHAEAPMAERFISLDEAVARVRRQIDGEVISAKTRMRDGRPVHHIKVYDRGRVRTFRVDARSGRML